MTTHRDLCEAAKEILADYVGEHDISSRDFLAELVALFDGPKQREADRHTTAGISAHEYQDAAQRTLPERGKNHWFKPERVADTPVENLTLEELERLRAFQRRIDLWHGASKICAEAGELMGPIAASMFYGKPLDKDAIDNIKEELGDLLWYIAAPMCRALNCTLAELMESNVAKLRRRYPEKYTDAAAIARADKQENNQPATGGFDRPLI